METRKMKLADIKPADYNPRVTLKPGDTEYEALKGSLDRFGLVEPLVWNERTGNLVSGHQRLNILLANGETEAEVVVIDADEEDEKLANVAINKIEGDWDYEKLKELFEEIEDEDIKFTGFTEEELNNLFDAGLPEFDDTESSGGEKSGDETEKTPDEPEKPKELHEFNIFLSFPTKELAEKWMKDRGIDLTYEGTARNITIRMEGLDYGKAD